jgi:hypothetical protein
MGISLTGVALVEEGGRSLPLGSVSAAQTTPGTAQLGLALGWRADRVPDFDARISLRLVAEDGGVVLQQDDGLWNARYLPTAAWAAGEQSESLHLLALPPDLPSGVYELVAVVYNQASLVPTVIVDVWQPEVRLGAVDVVRLGD